MRQQVGRVMSLHTNASTGGAGNMSPNIESVRYQIISCTHRYCSPESANGNGGTMFVSVAHNSRVPEIKLLNEGTATKVIAKYLTIDNAIDHPKSSYELSFMEWIYERNRNN